jgi:hypothetical protein
MERYFFVPPGFWELITPSQIRARVIPMVPKRRGFLRPTRSRIKIMKIESEGSRISTWHGWRSGQTVNESLKAYLREAQHSCKFQK